MPLHSAPPPGVLRPPAKASIEIHRELRWLKADAGSHQLHAYWAPRTQVHRWHRFEITRRVIVLGPFLALHVHSMRGGKRED